VILLFFAFAGGMLPGLAIVVVPGRR